MGAGSSALIWYGLCFAFVAFVVIISTGLILYGQRVEAKRRPTPPPPGPARGEAPEPEAPPHEEGDAPTSLDPESGDR